MERTDRLRGVLSLIQAVLGRLPFRPADIALLYMLRCEGIPDIALQRAAAAVDTAGPEDADELSCCVNKGWKFRRRFGQGDHCIKAKIGDEVAGYLWFSAGGSHVEELYGYEIKIPDGAVYCYDEYVSPEHRQKGIFKQLCRELAGWMRRNNRRTILVLVASGNELSRKVHTKMGFRPVKRIFLVRVPGFAYTGEREIGGPLK